MSDYAHIQHKSQQSLTESREITSILVENPNASPVAGYRTQIAPALILDKSVISHPDEIAVLDSGMEPIPAYLSSYETGLNRSEVWWKTVLTSGGVRQIYTGDGPWIHSIGATVGLPDPAGELGLGDWWNKNVVTDLGVDTVTILADAQFNMAGYTSGNPHPAQAILYPISARHIVKTSTGVLHAVAAVQVAGVHRIVHFWSSNGGEVWSSEIIDPGEIAMEYYNPSITIDKNDGLHITYAKFDGIMGSTYWLYSGADTPSGFECVSDVGDPLTNRVVAGSDSSYIGYRDTYDHGYSAAWGSANVCSYASVGPDNSASCCYETHPTMTETQTSESHLPPYKSFRLLKYLGIPTYLPAGVVIPFDAAVPAGFTRYSTQDGLYIRTGSSVGATGGSTQHRHRFQGTISGHPLNCSASLGSHPLSHPYLSPHVHDHTFDLYSAYQNNIPPSHNIYLGSLDAQSTTIPSGSILMFDTAAPVLASLFTHMSGPANALYERCLVGANGYSSIAGNVLHKHGTGIFSGNSSASSSGCQEIFDEEAWWYDARCGHVHPIQFTLQDAYLYPALVAFIMEKTNAAIDCTTFGCDVFYRYQPPGGSWTSPVNISQLYSYLPAFESTVLCDSNDDPHVVYSSCLVNATTNRPAVCYKARSGGIWGAREQVSSADLDMRYPSMDIDDAGEIHVAWFDMTNYSSLQYRHRDSGGWDAIEEIDGDDYVGFPSNIVCDKNNIPHLIYKKWSDPVTTIGDIIYRHRTGGAWSAAVNLSDGKATGGYNQFPGQMFIDTSGTKFFTWSGKGYAGHTTVYHPVYRYLTPDGMYHPPLVDDATDLLPDDDLETIMCNVFWHTNPLANSVYHNINVRGLTMMYLYNVRGGSDDTADLVFYSDKDAMVGDSGPVGSGGSGSSDRSPGGVGGESIIEQTAYTITTRGYVCPAHSPMSHGSYIS